MGFQRRWRHPRWGHYWGPKLTLDPDIGYRSLPQTHMQGEVVTRKAEYYRKANAHECECCGSGLAAHTKHRTKHREVARVHREEVQRKKELIRDITADELEKIIAHYNYGKRTYE